MPNTVASFYSDLPNYDIPVHQLVNEPGRFTPVPEDWVVVVTDVRNSTGAISKGLHQEVNLTATGCIIAALNLAHKSNLTIPFFFGGDGASLLIPPEMVEDLMAALTEHQQNILRNFRLVLRVGQYQVKMVRGEQPFLISKVKISEEYYSPVILGSGLQFAEKLLKQRSDHQEELSAGASVLDLSGMECRWEAVKPPKPVYEVLCLLINACYEAEQPAVYRKVLQKIDEIYGVLPARNPISVQNLKLTTSLNRIKKETLTKLGHLVPAYLIRNWWLTILGHWYIKYDQTGKNYVRRLVELSNTLVLDGRINTVISGTEDQRKQLIGFLDQMEERKEIIYGWHASSESIMSCYVRDRQDQHIHFIDGAAGGYTKAAGVLKSKL